MRTRLRLATVERDQLVDITAEVRLAVAEEPWSVLDLAD
jgi:thiamine phosphate synthase YjbQ (UPF0047 family)